jgi:hypothetical protein
MFGVKNMDKVLKLVNGAIFPDLNRSKGLDVNCVTTELPLNELKYKHLKEMQTLNLQQQMSYIIMVLTGLTEQDLDEISSDDAAELIGIVHKLLERHITLGKHFLDMTRATAPS